MKNRLQQTTDDGGADAPYDHLYIYHLEGRVTPTYSPGRPDFIGLWQETDSAFLFFERAAPTTIAELVRSNPGLTYHDCYHLTYDQWHGSRFEAFEQGDLRVVPAWQADSDGLDTAASSRTILLDPGVVFGVGTHPTTRDCLSALQLAYKGAAPAKALDLGTGTGLLALAAVRLGCSQVVAVDMNGLAAKTAQANVRLNQMQDYVMVTQGDALDLVRCPADLVIANIHYDVMRHLILNKGFLAKKQFILSGLMRSEAKHIVDTLQRYPVKILKPWTQNGIWHTIYGEAVRK